MVICYRTVSQTEYDAWHAEYQEAEVALVNRTQQMDAVAEVIEKELTLLGSVGKYILYFEYELNFVKGIEDKLQEGVPDVIEALGKAGVKVWVLTGDKLETAVSVSTSCRLLSPEVETVMITESNKEQLVRRLEEIVKKYELVATNKSWYKHGLEYLTNCTWPVDDAGNNLLFLAGRYLL